MKVSRDEFANDARSLILLVALLVIAELMPVSNNPATMALKDKIRGRAKPCSLFLSLDVLFVFTRLKINNQLYDRSALNI